MPDSSDLSDLRCQFEANEAALTAVMEGLTAAELNQQPEGGRAWSILQCTQHLVLSDAAYAGAIRAAVDASRLGGPHRAGSIQASAAGRLFLKKLEPPVKAKVRAPSSIVPEPQLEKDVVIAGYMRVHEQIRALLRDAGELDFNRIKFRNPLLRLLRVRAGTGLLIMAGHERRHLWQAGQVRNMIGAAR